MKRRSKTRQRRARSSSLRGTRRRSTRKRFSQRGMSTLTPVPSEEESAEHHTAPQRSDKPPVVLKRARTLTPQRSESAVAELSSDSSTSMADSVTSTEGSEDTHADWGNGHSMSEVEEKSDEPESEESESIPLTPPASAGSDRSQVAEESGRQVSPRAAPAVSKSGGPTLRAASEVTEESDRSSYTSSESAPERESPSDRRRHPAAMQNCHAYGYPGIWAPQ